MKLLSSFILVVILSAQFNYLNTETKTSRLAKWTETWGQRFGLDGWEVAVGYGDPIELFNHQIYGYSKYDCDTKKGMIIIMPEEGYHWLQINPSSASILKDQHDTVVHEMIHWTLGCSNGEEEQVVRLTDIITFGRVQTVTKMTKWGIYDHLQTLDD